MSHLIDKKIFFRNYFEIDKKKSGSVWHPVFDFANLTYYEQTKVYGGSDPHRLMYYKKEQNMEYSETFHLKFSCHFDFTDYPFDSHECFMHYGSYDTDASEVTLTPPTISYRKSVTRNGDKPMNLQGLPHVYEVIIESLPSFDWIDNIDNTPYSYTGMSFKLKRKNLGYLSSSFYYPTASFALLSMISFLVKPDAVSFLKKLL